MSFLNKSSGIKTSLIIIAVVVIAVISYKIGAGGLGNSGIDSAIARWIENNPEKIIESVTNMQKKAMEQQFADAQKNIGDKKDELFSNKKSPAFAPQGYDVTIVEFFDYNCGYCKKAQTAVEQLLKEDKKVRVVYKEFPILGASSQELARIALAVNILDTKKYHSFHDALMKSNARSKEEALQIAKNQGLDTAKLNKILADKKSEIDAQISENLQLGAAIGVNGTPGFVIGEELIPGAVETATLKEKVAALRK